MNSHIPGGNFAVARTIFNSAIWLKPPIYTKIWLWIIGRANYATYQKNGYTYQRGELVTTYDEIIRSNSHYHNRSHISPTIKQIRIILNWLQSENMILVKPLKSGLGPTGADTTARTRAYTGLKITVINYDTYQNPESYKGRHKGRDLSQLGHNIKKEIKKNNINSPTLSEESVKQPPIIHIPLVTKNDTGNPIEFPIFQKDIDEWKNAFPGIDILQEIKKCRAWNINNPKNRKTERGIRRHINSWLDKAHNKARPTGGKSVANSPRKYGKAPDNFTV